MNNKKGSTIVWAVTLIMLLMVIVGASLSLAYVHYNQSIKNHNHTQAELIANSAIKSLASVIEKGDQNDQIIPSEVNGVTNIYKMELDQPFGSISDIKVIRKKKNLVIASLKATYSEQSYTLYAYIVQSNGVWKAVQYDTNGNRSIKASESTGGNTGDNTGGNTGGNTNYLPEGSNQAETLGKRIELALEQYFGDKKNINSFRDWYKKQCDFMNKSYQSAYTDEYRLDALDTGNDGNFKQSFLYCMTDNNQFEALDNTIYQAAKDQGINFGNSGWTPDYLYVSFHVFPNSKGKYFIYATQGNNEWSNSVYMIYYNGSWYGSKNAPQECTTFSSNEDIENAIKDTTKWQKVE